MDEKKYTNPLDGLYEIVGDLWSRQRLQEAAEKLQNEKLQNTLQDTLHNTVQAPETAQASVPASAPSRQAETQNTAAPIAPLPSFDQLWQTADETIDWTDLLAGRNSMAMDPASPRFRFLKDHAAAVLEGSLQDYGAVLQEVRPLDDMKAYAHHIRVRAVSPDEISVTFEAFPKDAEDNETDYERYLCGIALRCARDIFAVLPVLKVRVAASAGGEDRLKVSFQRSDMQKTLFNFIDPVDFVMGLGAEMHICD